MTRRRFTSAMQGVAGLLLLAAGSAAGAATYTLPVTPATVAWGHYDAASQPVLRIRSGDTVVFDTLITSSPTALEKGGVAPGDVQASLRDVYFKVPASARGTGVLILTGPVFVECAEPCDTL